MSHPGQRAFTLLELLLALSIVAALLVIMFGGLRVGLTAWRRGDEQAARLDHERSLIRLLDQTLAGSFPYVGTLSENGGTGIVFDGQTDRLTFVTASAPLLAPVPAPFTLVSLSQEPTGLALRQLVMPNRGPLDRIAPALVDPLVAGVRFRYLGDGAAWRAEWDMSKEETLPRAVEVVLTTIAGSRAVELPPITVPIRAAAP